MLNALQTIVLHSKEFSHINLFQVQQQIFSLSGLRWFLAGATSGKGSCVSNKHFSFFLTTAKLNFWRHKPLAWMSPLSIFFSCYGKCTSDKRYFALGWKLMVVQLSGSFVSSFNNWTHFRIFSHSVLIWLHSVVTWNLLSFFSKAVATKYIILMSLSKSSHDNYYWEHRHYSSFALVLESDRLQTKSKMAAPQGYNIKI